MEESEGFSPQGKIVWDEPYEPQGEITWDSPSVRQTREDSELEVETLESPWSEQSIAMRGLEESLAREDARLSEKKASPETIDTGVEGTLQALQEEATSNILSFLQGEVVDKDTQESFGVEGFKTATYNPGGKSGITIGTGVDLKHHTKGSMLKIGVPEGVAEKLSPYYGKSDKDLEGQSPLTKEEVELVDKKVLQHEEASIREKIPTYDNLPDEIKAALVMSVHQYGMGTNFFQQIKDEDYVAAFDNLADWGDKTEGLGGNINKKYAAVGKLLEEKYGWLAQEQQYASLKNGWYRDPDTGEKFEIEDGKRV